MLARRLLLTLPVNLAQAAAGFGAVVVFTRLLSPEDYGRYALILSATMLGHTLALTWAEAAAFRFMPAATAGRDLRSHYATLLAVAAAAAGVAGATSALLLALLQVDGAYLPAAMIAMVGAGFRFIARIARESERAGQETGRYAARETGYVLLGFTLGAALAATTSLGPAAPFAGTALAGLVIAVPDLFRLRALACGGAASASKALAFAGYGAPLALALALDLGLQTAVRALLAGAHGEAALGALAAAFGLASRALDMIFVWAGLSGGPLLLAAYEARDVEGLRTASAAMARTLFALAAPAAVGLALIAQPLCEAMIGPALAAAAAPIVPWLALTGFLAGLATHYYSEAFQLGRRTLVRAGLIGLATAAAMAAAPGLVAAHGAVGAAMALALAAGLALALLAGVGRFFLPLATPWPDIAKIAAATALMAGVVQLMPASGGWGEALAKAAAGAAAYGVMALLLDLAGVRARLGGLLLRRADCIPKEA